MKAGVKMAKAVPCITAHAVQRFRERVCDMPEHMIVAVLTCPAVIMALEFGAPFVRLGTGQRIVIEDGAIITVLPSDTTRGRLDPRRRNATGARRAPISKTDFGGNGR